jgi:hypothetical protein
MGGLWHCFTHIMVKRKQDPVAMGIDAFLCAKVRITETCTDVRTNSLPADTPTFRFREAR